MILLLPKNVFYLFMQLKPTIVTLHQIGEIFEQPLFVIRTTGPISRNVSLKFLKHFASKYKNVDKINLLVEVFLK
jgi:hypothetical protein